MRTRLALGALGAFAIAYGTWRILQQQHLSRPTELGKWLVAAVLLHDAVIVPLTLAIGFALTFIRPRARRYVQGALVTAAVVCVVAIPLIYRRGTQPPVKALEQQNYGGHLAVLLGLIVAVAASLYVVTVVSNRGQRDGVATARPSAEQTPDVAS